MIFPDPKEREMPFSDYEYAFRLDYEDETFEVVRVVSDSFEAARETAASDPEVAFVTSLGFVDRTPQTALAF